MARLSALRRAERALFFLLALCLALTRLPAAASSPAQQPAATPAAPATPTAPASPLGTPGADLALPSTFTVGDCSRLDRTTLRPQIEQAALAVLSAQQGALDLDALVERKWVELGVDALINAEVARAVAALGDEETYWQRFLSGWSAEKAEEFAGRIAQDAFASDAFHAKIAELSDAVAAEIARAVDAEFTRAASAGLLCLQEYVGAHYSNALQHAFEQSVSQSVANADLTLDPAQLDLSLLGVHGTGAAGVSIIVATEVARRVSVKISQRISQRIAGKVVGRVAGRAGSSLLPVIGWVVGLGLIAYDLYEGGKGALPQIEESLTSEEVKQRLRDEVVAALRDGIPEEVSIAALEIAVTLVEEWDAFCAANRDLCSLAGDNPSFRTLLDTLPLNRVGHLAALTGIIADNLGRAALLQSVESGALDQLAALPPAATRILTATGSISATLAWGALAGPNLDQVIAYRIHEQADPGEFDATHLATLLAVNDPAAVAALLALQPQETSALLVLPSDTLRLLAGRLQSDDLRAVVDYLRQPVPPGATPPAQIVAAVAVGDLPPAALQTPPGAQPAPGAAETPSAASTASAPPTAPAAAETGRTPGASPGALALLAAVIVASVTILLLWVWRRRKPVV